MDYRNIKIIISCFLFLVVGTGSVFAFGISSPYWDDHPLEMFPGQTKEIAFNLQNCPSLAEYCDGEDVNVVATFVGGSEIAEITSGLDYFVPFGTMEANIVLKIEIPETASIGDEYKVEFSVSAPNVEEGGNVQLGVKYSVDFPVIVVPESDVPEVTMDEDLSAESGKVGGVIITVAGIIVVIALLFFLFRKKRQV